MIFSNVERIFDLYGHDPGLQDAKTGRVRHKTLTEDVCGWNVAGGWRLESCSFSLYVVLIRYSTCNLDGSTNNLNSDGPSELSAVQWSKYLQPMHQRFHRAPAHTARKSRECLSLNRT